MTIGRKIRQNLSQTILYVLLIASSLMAVGPVSWVWMTSLKSNKEIRGGALSLPTQLRLENYAEAWRVGRFSVGFSNSAIVGAGAVVIVLVVGSLAAYAFARMRFKGSSLLFYAFYAGMTVPVAARVVPMLSMMYKLNLVDTKLGLILAYAAGNLPFSILMMRSFFRQFPQELEDAAEIDGCSHLQFFRRVLLPLSTPSLSVLGILTFMNCWNELYLALILINSSLARTLPLGLIAFQGKHYVNYALSIAGTTIAAFPVVIVYVLFQKNFIEGMTAGSVK